MKRYITQNPKLEANKELKDISSLIGCIKKTTIQEWIDNRYKRYKDFLG